MNDLEFRVWDTYRWTADDFGVMPKVAETLRGNNDALRLQHTAAEIATALDRLVEIDLITEFDHQGAPYVCSIRWNKYQKIEYPRQTFFPAPPPELIQRMDVSTRKLFRNFHESFRKIATSRARTRAKRLTANANGKRLTAKAKRERSGEGPRRASFERWWTIYPRKIGKDAAWREWQRIAPDDALVTVMLAKVEEQRRSTAWCKDSGTFIPKPYTWLHEGRWQDESEIAPPPDDGDVAGDTWNEILGLVRPRIDGWAYARHLVNLRPVLSSSSETFSVLAPSREHRDQIPADVEQQLAHAVREVCHKRLHFMWGSGLEPHAVEERCEAKGA